MDDDHKRWQRKAEENIDEWGKQSIDTLLLATMEELGELAQAYLEARYEDGNPARVQRELDDLMALGCQIQRRYND
jgi:NTP pyrophosphatase (non-canonical NTP hydrolase)